jgi:hypothetical protein
MYNNNSQAANFSFIGEEIVANDLTGSGLLLALCLTMVWNEYVSKPIKWQIISNSWASLTTSGSIMLGQQRRDQKDG